VKTVASLVIVAALALAIVRVPVSRYRANLERTEVNRLLDRAEKATSEYEKRRLALAAIEKASRWLALDPADYKLLVARGAAEALAGSPDRAIETYQQALTLNERREIYTYLGVLQMNRGEVDAAIENLTRAAAFNTTTKRYVAPHTQYLIDKALEERRLRLVEKAEKKRAE
jgi:tetratricopeptide (TPR) repeat protein